MKLGILATGTAPEELRAQYGSYADMVEQLFYQTRYSFEYEVFDVRDGIFPGSAEQCDGWVITGSKFNVSEGLDWMLHLKQLILEISATGRPLVGICFGHQIIAEAFGGRVAANTQGWGVGLHRYQLTHCPDFMMDSTQSFTISAMHQYEVSEKPEQAEVLATSEFCRNAAMFYPNKNILTFQAHPEFNTRYEHDLIELRRSNPIPAETADAGLATLRQSDAATDSIQVARWMGAFLSDCAA